MIERERGRGDVPVVYLAAVLSLELSLRPDGAGLNTWECTRR
jgi:hypothetical protein